MLGGAANARFGEVASFGEAGGEGLGEEFGGVQSRVDGVAVGGGFDVVMIVVVVVVAVSRRRIRMTITTQ